MNEAPMKSGAVFKLEGIMNLFMRVLAIIFICYAVRSDGELLFGF